MSKGDYAGSRADRAGRYFARTGWAHLLLLTGTAIFLFPFLWMLVTSLKTDEEVQEAGWWPQVPVMRQSSPYARPPVVIHRPTYVTEAQWTAALPTLHEVAGVCVADFLTGQHLTYDAESLRAATTSVLIDQLAPRLQKSDWSLPPDQLAGAFAKLLTDDTLAAAVDDRLASLDLLSLQVRALDASIHNLAPQWLVTSGDATLQTRGQTPAQTNYLHYRFPSAGAAPITLTAGFDFPIDPDQLHKLILTIKPDNSWHALNLTLDVAGTRFIATRPVHLAQHRVTGILFQPPSFDDTTLAAKTWVPLKKIPNPQSQIANRKSQIPASLTLTLTPSSTFSATLAKSTRNYWRAFHAVPFWRYLANSLLLVALTTIGMLFSSTFVAYAFARLHWPGRSIALIVLLSTMMLPAQVTFIPQFLIWRQLGWYNTLNPLWVPAFCGGAFFIFLMTQTMKTLPRELEESARIDGLNSVQTWYYIILPQVKPTAAAIAVMTFMWSWNEFLGPLIYLRDQSKFPLSLGLFAMRLENFGDWSLIMAGNVLMTLPVIVLFFLCQRYFIQGMTMSGMK